MIRVLHVIDHLGLGGAQSALLDIVANAEPSEACCEVAVMHGRGLFAEELERRGVKVHSLSPRRWPPAYIPNFARLVRTRNFDVLHFHLSGANWIAKPMSALFCRARRVAHDHSSADLAFRRWWSLFPDSFGHFFSHRVIAVSEGVARFLATRELVPRRKIIVSPNGIDTRLFVPPSKERRDRARAEMGLGAGDFVVGAMGRLAPEKNLRSIVELARQVPGCQFVIAGDGPEMESLRRSGGELSNFRLLGNISDRPGFYAALDVFVLPSLHEALPMTILESMAAGIPIIASDLEGVSSALHGCGTLVAPGDTCALKEALTSVSGNLAAAAERALLARERVEKQFDARIVSARMMDVYRSTLPWRTG